MKPYTAMLLKLLYSAVLDERSSAAKRAFASSCATVLKYASPSQAQKLIEDTTSLHLGGKNDQLSGAILIKAYLSNAADVLSGYNAAVIPVIFASRYVKDTLKHCIFMSSDINVSDVHDALKFSIVEMEAFPCV